LQHEVCAAAHEIVIHDATEWFMWLLDAWVSDLDAVNAKLQNVEAFFIFRQFIVSNGRVDAALIVGLSGSRLERTFQKWRGHKSHVGTGNWPPTLDDPTID
jgi:hypothetical protein